MNIFKSAVIKGGGSKRPPPSAIFGKLFRGLPLGSVSGTPLRGARGGMCYMLTVVFALALCVNVYPRVFSEPDPGGDPPESAAPAALSAETVVPHIASVAPRELSYDDGDWMQPIKHFGSITVSNPDTVSFVLRISFENGGLLKRDDDGTGKPGERNVSIRLQNLALVYNSAKLGGGEEEIKLNQTIYNSNGEHYEAEFRAAAGDVQEEYEFELRGELHTQDARVVRNGIYRETAYFSIEYLW